jgi:hypothetical protein
MQSAGGTVKTRVFIGSDVPETADEVPDWTYVDETFDDWAAARTALRERLARWLDDDCQHCREQVRTMDMPALDALNDGAGYQTNIEGDEYALIPQAE